MDDPGARRDHRPRKAFWARFSEQETGPQKVLVGLAGTMTALATTVGGIYALSNVVRDDTSTVATDPNTATISQDPSLVESTGPSTDPSTDPSGDPSGTAQATPSAAVTTRPGQTLVAQGSPEADALVHALVDEPGRRADLDVVVLAQHKDQTPQWIMQLWYNCHDLPAGQPPGEDLCDSVVLVFDDAVPSPTRFDEPLRIELKGLWADNRPSGAGYGARGLEIYPVPAAF